MIRYVAPNYITRHFITDGSHKVPIAPELTTPQLPSQLRKLAKHLSRRYALQDLHNTSWRQPGRCFKEYVYMILYYLHRVDDHIVLFGNPLENLFDVLGYLFCQDALSIFRNPYEMVFEIVNRMFASSQSTHALTVSRLLASGNSFPADTEPAFLPPASWGVSSGS